MNTLCIDAGNTFIKGAVRDSDTWREVFRWPTHRFNAEFGHQALTTITTLPHRWCASIVAGEEVREALMHCAKICGVDWFEIKPTPEMVVGSPPINVLNRYQRPEQLGADRFTAMIGAIDWLSHHHLLANDSLVLLVSAGTALTIDALRIHEPQLPHRHRLAEFVGGTISAGVQLQRDALHHQTAQLPAVIEPAPPYSIHPPRTTEHAIAQGTRYALLGAIMVAAHHWRGAAKKINVLVSGGDSAMIYAGLQSANLIPDVSTHYCPYLIWDGLRVFGEEMAR